MRKSLSEIVGEGKGRLPEYCTGHMKSETYVPVLALRAGGPPAPCTAKSLRSCLIMQDDRTTSLTGRFWCPHLPMRRYTQTTYPQGKVSPFSFSLMRLHANKYFGCFPCSQKHNSRRTPYGENACSYAMPVCSREREPHKLLFPLASHCVLREIADFPLLS